MSGEPRTSIRLIWDNLRLRQPDKGTDGRSSYNLSFHSPLYPGFRYDAYLMIAPDTKEKSRSVDIRQHYWGVFAGASLEKVHLFRYSIGLAQGVWQKITNSHILGSRSSVRTLSMASLLRLGLDYAPSEWAEVGMSLSLFYRAPRNAADWSWGLGLIYNL